MIENGKKVRFNYTLTVEGEVVDSSKDRGAFEYKQGAGEIVPGLERQMQGLKKGDEKTIIVAAEEGYGEINEEAFQEIPRDHLPEDLELQRGVVLKMKTEDGHEFPVVINEVKEDVVVINLNHPLAGKELQFDVEILDIA